jgi:hypothetical protein
MQVGGSGFTGDTETSEQADAVDVPRSASTESDTMPSSGGGGGGGGSKQLNVTGATDSIDTTTDERMTKITLDDEVPNVRSTTTADSESGAPSLAPSAPPAPPAKQ